MLWKSLPCVLGTVILVTAAGACTGGNKPSPSPTPAVSATAESTATPEPTPFASATPTSPDVRTLQPGMRGLIGYDTVVYYHIDCYACGGAEDNLWRAYLAPDGRLVKEQLLPLDRIPAGGRVYSTAYNLAFGEAWAAVCVQGYCGQEGDPSEDARNVVLHSIDGGVTWKEEGSLPRGVYMAGMDEKRLIVREYLGGSQYRHSYYPGGDQLQAQAGVPDSAFPMTYGVGVLYWRDRVGTKLWASDGREIVLPVPRGAGNVFLADHDKGAGLSATWRGAATWVTDASRDVPYIGRFHTEANGTYSVDKIWAWEGETLWFGGMLTGVTGFGSALYSEEPCLLIGCENDPTPRKPALEAVILQLDTNTVHPIPELSEDLAGNRHPFVITMLRRQVAKVVTGTGCLNVRAQPSMSSEVVACYADSVLLWHYGEEEEAEGQTWLRVSVPDGRTGWAATSFLAY